MKSDDFENQLQRTPMREIPAEWRAEILMRAEGGRRKAEGRQAASWWRDLLWPSPVAWAALGCVWVVIVAANADWDGARSQQQTEAPVSPETMIARLAQERSFTESKGMF
jgi:hypothetical protein